MLGILRSANSRLPVSKSPRSGPAELLRRSTSRWMPEHEHLGACPRNGRIFLARQGRVGFSGGMSKTFRPWKIDEPLLLPATVQEFVAKDHLAHFVLSVVRDEVDLGEITSTYEGERG